MADLSRTIRLCGILMAVASVALHAQQQVATLSDEEKALHVLSRLGYGHTPRELEAVRKIGVDAWIEQQLSPLTLDDGPLENELKKLTTLGQNPSAARKTYDEAVEAGKKSGKAVAVEQLYAKAMTELQTAVVLRSQKSNRQAFEVITDFWRNHFNVDIGKEDVSWTATHYEEAVLRPNALGNFGAMLDATARHPAMLVYLDNALSRKPPPKSELRQIERRARKQTGSREAAKELAEIARQSGLNENYARELLELHTLGVDNGYTQQDVTEVARAFTGWTRDYAEGGTGFVFRHDLHDTGPKTVLGKSLPEGRQKEAISEGETILRRLAHHENTAGFLARKLVRHFVNDTPPPAIVAAAEKAFRASKGDIKTTLLAIVKHPEFFARENFRAKFKTPLEFVISALRATNATIHDPYDIVVAIANLGLEIYGMEDPTGYSDAAEAWRDPGVMALRWRFAINLVNGQMKGAAIPETFYDDLPENLQAMLDTLVSRLVPAGLGPGTRSVLDRILLQDVAAGKTKDARGRRALSRKLAGILIGCPEFQQQ